MIGSNGNTVDYFIDRNIREGRGDWLATPVRGGARLTPNWWRCRRGLRSRRAAKLATLAWYHWRIIRIGERVARGMGICCRFRGWDICCESAEQFCCRPAADFAAGVRRRRQETPGFLRVYRWFPQPPG